MILKDPGGYGCAHAHAYKERVFDPIHRIDLKNNLSDCFKKKF
ncbi:hypothetical protein SEGD1_271 [Enterobacteria phage SEGD1]|uniref:Uncharacterized protein n=1 Tax=Enterobacteria phage SEGD1 TaxID=1805456 RepID=A0A142IIY0_9CAUD|nr:hypothetical protein SEGD1_271 [Enterobacteria phage SEGD1]